MSTEQATKALMEKHAPQEYEFTCQKCSKVFIKVMSPQRYANPKNHPKHCCRACANARIRTEEIKQKVSRTLISHYDKVGRNGKKQKGYWNNICQVCGKPFESKGKSKYCCDKCRHIATHNKFVEAGKRSAALQGEIRRSKNERLFCTLCENKFNYVTHNDPIFNSWDADVLIHDLKIAILWNGPWHYKQITKHHSVAQVQNRDKIKVSEIKKAGWIPYIIQDNGKYNESFVREQFDLFIKNIAP